MKTLCVNIDVDPLRMYRGIHSLPQREEGAEVYTLGVQRFVDFANSLGIKTTIFAVAEDVKGDAIGVLQNAIKSGHEVASHSMTHPYGLFKHPDLKEIEGSKKLLEDTLGVKIVGFRSPGYNVSKGLLNTVAKYYSYDSSILPSPPYFMARAAVIIMMGMMGRKSSSYIGNPGQFFKGNSPFKWKLDSGELTEFPMSGVFGVPIIGTTLASSSSFIRYLVTRLSKRSFINIEFHAIDFMDITDGLEEELKVEPALKVPLEQRIARFKEYISMLKEGATSLTLASL